jgi:Fungal specific transcription factor domain
VLPNKLRGRIPEFLKAVMRFCGSHFVQNGNRDALKDIAVTQFLPSAPEDGFKVQALALLAMTSFSRTEQEEGQAYLKSAIDLALWIGLNQKDFAVRSGESDATIEESWRRTWWDLFIVEGLIATFTGQMESSRLRTVKADVLLPGDCDPYNACSPLGNPRSYGEMQDRAFSDDDFQWSSFAYKIEAMHLLYSVGALGADTFATTNSEVETLDQRLSNFRLSLPNLKKDALKTNGEVDEVMFGALMTANCAEITLHR